MDLTAEQITEFGLSEEQVGKINTWSNDTVANTKKDYDGKANTDAEAILTGASAKILETTKIERNQGEKIGDYIPRAWGEFNTVKLSEVQTAKIEYEDKVRNFKGDEAKDSKILELETEMDSFKQKYANYDELKVKADKYDPLSERYEANKMQVAFSSVKPSFPKEANEYEVSAKWNEFKKGVLEKYNLEIVDGEAKAIDKENIHKIVKLSELVKKDETLINLTKGRQQEGTGGKPIPKIDIEGVPFKVPEGSEKDSQIRTKAVQDYLISQSIAPTSDEWSKKFREYNNAIINKK